MKNIIAVIFVLLLITGCAANTPSSPSPIPPEVNTPTPQPENVISPENANRITVLSSWDIPNYREAEDVNSFSPDDKLLATSNTKSITIWDLDEQIPINKFDTGRINIISPNWLWVIATSAESPEKMMLYDFSNGNLLNQWNPDSESTQMITTKNSFSPDGNILAQLERPGNKLRLWAIPEGSLIRDIQGGSIFSNALAFSPDGKTIASTYGTNSVYFWDVASGTELEPLQTAADSIYYVVFSPDGKTLAAVNGEMKVSLWDLVSGNQGPDLGLTLAVDPDSGVELFTQTPITGIPLFSPDGRILAVLENYRTAYLLNASTGELLAILGTDNNPVVDLVFSRDGTQIATTNYGQVVIWGVGSTEVSLPTATVASLSPLQLPQTNQPKCWTILVSSSPDPTEITDLHQSEVTFNIQSSGTMETLVNKYGNFEIQQLEINELTIGEKTVALKNQQISNSYIQTEEFGDIVILSGDSFGSCMVMIVTPEQFTQIDGWIQ